MTAPIRPSTAGIGVPPAGERPPGPGECEYCGSAPAIKVAPQSLLGLVLFYRITTYKAHYCRDCGRAMIRELNAKTLVGGWWSIGGPILVAIGLLFNGIRLLRLRGLAAPVPQPGVVGRSPAPMVVGPPLWRRPLPAIMTVVMLVVWGIVIAALFAG